MTSTITTGTITAPTVRSVDVEGLRAALLDGAEIAVLDLREGDAFAGGHLSVAVPVTDSDLELRIDELVPRRDVRLVLTDDAGSAVAESAAVRLLAVGYTDVRVLTGGVPAWAAAGYELITGLNSLSKALGEFVERRLKTPRITVDQLKAKLEAGEDVVVLDTRPLPEYRHIAIPGGRPAPGAELLYRVFDQLPSPTTQVVVNCAGRTRAIIGAQALINAGVTNPVVSLENGTSAWLFAGYEPVAGTADLLEAPSAPALQRATAAAEALRERFEVPVSDSTAVAAWLADGSRTTYLLDVRTPEEYAAGHLPGAVSAPGGQLVQATDAYVAVRHARIVLADTPDLVRASVTASWLKQLGLDEVVVHGASPEQLTASGLHPADPAAGLGVSTVSPSELAAWLRERDDVTVIDLQPASPYFQARLHVPDSLVSRRSTLLHRPGEAPSGTVVLVSEDGRAARLSAAELSAAELSVGEPGAAAGRAVHALDGGIRAWAAAGHEVAQDAQVPLTPQDALPPQPDLEARKRAFAEYVAWGDVIIDQLERDGLVRFREYPARFREYTA